jgi:hypothetical protein
MSRREGGGWIRGREARYGRRGNCTGDRRTVVSLFYGLLGCHGGLMGRDYKFRFKVSSAMAAG